MTTTSTFERVLSLKQLRLIVTLAKERHLSRTADLIHITQPAASRMLAQLEELVGARLFDRSTKRVVPTSAGLRLVHHAHRILAQIEEAESDLRGSWSGSEEYRIGVLPTFATDLLARAIRSLNGMMPNLRLKLTEAMGGDLYADLLSGSIDVMLSHAEIPVDLSKVEVLALYDEFPQTLCGAGHRLAGREKVTWKELAQERWLLPQMENPLRGKLDRVLAVHRKASHANLPDIEISRGQVALSLLQQDDCLWITSRRQARNHVESGRVCMINQKDELVSGPMCCFNLRGEKEVLNRMFKQCLQEAI